MEPSDVIILTPSGRPDPSLAIAASRAGAMGVLELEHLIDHQHAVEAISRLVHHCGRRFGVQISVQDVATIELIRALDVHPSLIVLAGRDDPGLTATRVFQSFGIEVFREATGLDEAIAAVDLGVDGIILKGNESGGRIGSDTSFILIQKWCQYADRHSLRHLPFWVRGGIGPNTAAACLAAGARGVVLDSQVLLARESPFSEAMRSRAAGLDGGETTVVGDRFGETYRVFARADSPPAQELLRDEERLKESSRPQDDLLKEWRTKFRSSIGLDPATSVWMVGQDIALAPGLASRGVTVAGIVQLICKQATKQLNSVFNNNHIACDAPFAKSHATKYPILQGPMTRVSDTAAFAEAVAAGGALPFLALALLRKAETEQLLTETSARLGSRPWGVGILGFVPNEIRSEQIDAIRKHKPPYAIIAGGRPDQAKELESCGIPTYLHVPSPGLLRMFLKDGARRFIFEGQECGGHVGPRSSFALWESMTQILVDHIGSKPAADIHIAFAGGIHDGTSASMVAALSAGLVEKGVKVGVLLGTAYLFTHEAVEAGAITPRFQREALTCDTTVLLESGPGHAIRCIPTPYSEAFASEKSRLKEEGKSPLEIGVALERMNLGRLRVASKGVDRANAVNGNGSGLAPVSDDDQFRRGMFMIGQVAALRHEVTTVAELHADICAASKNLIASRVEAAPARPELEPPPPCDVAIIGLSCFYPGAGGLWPYWENILTKVNAVIEIPPTHWDWRPYYDPDPRAKDKMVSKWGGFMSDVTFDPLKYGITPKSLPNIEPLQLLLLEAVNRALGDAGYLDRAFARERTCAILGVGGGGMPLSVSYGFRACMPLLDSIPGVPVKSSQIIELGQGMLPEWTEDSFPGILLNVAAGRVANRFDLGGPNMAIDAACGSSLAALYAGVRELNDGTSDVAIVMGGDAVQTPYAYVAFSKTHALSPRGRCRPFDAAADGIALAEGVGVAVLKRLADAERDGDRVYAVIKGVGASSDGRDKGLTAPRAEGQIRALRRAYGQARLSPARVGLVEAHGTGTVVGDQTEARAIGEMFRESGGASQSCALGSVKSMIGHSKCAAGMAGLIKTAFALHHKILPPTLAESPNPKANLDGGPLFLNTEPRPWIHGAEHPRTAGVSAFGFGGTNFHTVLEEYTGDYLGRSESGIRKWPVELFVWRREDRISLASDIEKCRDAIANGASPALADLAAGVWKTSQKSGPAVTLAVVASGLDDLKDKLDVALAAFPKEQAEFTDPRGIYFAKQTEPATGKLAFLFPGQGSQYPDMLAQIAMTFPEAREVLDRAERNLKDDLDRPLGHLIYPPSAFTPEQDAANRKSLQQTEVAQPAIGAASLALLRVLGSLGIEADYYAGHSYGEYVALAAAGAIGEDELIRLSYRRGQILKEAAAQSAGGMIAADGTRGDTEQALGSLADVWIANQNSPAQTVLAGTEDGLAAATQKLADSGIRSQRVPVACGFHSPLIADAKVPLAAALEAAGFSRPSKPVFSNTTASPHSQNPAEIASLLAEHLVLPVRFADEIEAMHDAGARVFVEVGPQAVLTGLMGQILAGKPHLAVASDVKARPGLVQLAHLLGQLIAAGVAVNLDRLFRGREVEPLNLSTLGPDTGKPKLSATTWVVNGVRSRPVNGPEPRLLGQALSAVSIQPVPTRNVSATPAVIERPPTNGRTAAPVPVKKISAPDQHPTSPPAITIAPRAMMHTHSTTTGIANSAPPSKSTAPQTEGAAAVMLRFQDVMSRFLDTQRSVMLSFLGSDAAADVASIPPPTSTPAYQQNGSSHQNGNGHTRPVPSTLPPAVANRMATSEHPTPPPVKKTVDEQSAAVDQPATAESNGSIDPPVAELQVGLLDRDTLLARLLDLVSDRTGYPKEALSIDLDLEADLGIDSIKRVEVLGAFAESIGEEADGKQPNLEMEKLSVLKTLRGIADYVAEALVEAASPSDKTDVPALAPASPNGDLHPGARQGDVQRLVVKLIDTPLPPRPRFAPPAGTILITDDGLGTAMELADRFGELDIKAALIRMAKPGDAAGEFAADLTDPGAVEQLLIRIRKQCGSVSGLIHLLPLSEDRDDESSESRVWRDVKSLYLLARGLEPDIRSAAESGSAVLFSVTAMGGKLGFGGALPPQFPAGHGGVAGFTKSLGHEWPDVTVRVVDVSGDTPATHLAEQLLAELGDPDGPFEVGRSGDRRITWQVEPGPLEKDRSAPVPGPESTILITGGARGITAKIALELASRYQPKLVLVGRSALPAAEEADTSGFTTPAELKAALMKRMPDAKPAAVEMAYKRLLQDREIRANLDAIRSAGSTVDYRTIDVRDATEFGTLIDELNASGGITGVIHGAGVIEDKLLRDKTPESFDRVFGTKVDSALTLARKLSPEKLAFFALFSSITSRYGNRGQSDYAAANEVLSKLACDLDHRWPGRVVSIAWGPWAEVGMVADLEKHLVARGLKLIEPAVGAALAVDELIYGRKGEPEVLIAGGTERASRPPRPAPIPELAATAGAN